MGTAKALRWMLCSGALLGVGMWAGDASACHGQDGDARTTVCFTSLHAGLATLIFAPADIAYAADRRWLPSGWAWPQLWLGGIATFAGGVTAMGMAIHDSPDPALDITWASGVMVLGGFYGSVALFSLQNDRPGQHPHEDDAVAALGIRQLVVAPTPGGLMLGGSF